MQERTNVKACIEFGNDPMKMCFKHKTRMKVDHKIKDLKFLFLLSRLWFMMKHFLCFDNLTKFYATHHYYIAQAT